MKMFLLTTAVFLSFITGGFANPIVLTPEASNTLTLKDDISYNCPTGYSQPANSNWDRCYKLYTSHKGRSDAAAKCKTDNGTLSSVPNAFVNSYIYSLASQSDVTAVWIGIQCLNGAPSSCANDDNSYFVYNNFAPGQPTSDDFCVYMSTVGKNSQKWLTFDCGQSFQFVCEVAASSVPVSATTSKTTTTTTQAKKSCAVGWTEFQGYCYTKMDRQPTNEKQEEFYCQRDTPGGQLATISSPELNDFILSLPCNDNYFRIGLQCPKTYPPGDTSTCVWDDGTPFSYSNFAPGEPSSRTPHNCVYYYADKWYNSHSCDQPFQCFACQAPMQ